MSKPQTDGAAGELRVYQLLRRYGRKVQMGRYNEPFDILVDDSKRIEVKTCPSVNLRGRTAWCFNIHRHGTLDENNVDAYILRLEGVPEAKAALHLLVKAPLGVKRVNITLRSLFDRYAQATSDYRRFCKTGELPS
jgi:hypothetical protein